MTENNEFERLLVHYLPNKAADSIEDMALVRNFFVSKLGYKATSSTHTYDNHQHDAVRVYDVELEEVRCWKESIEEELNVTIIALIAYGIDVIVVL